MGFDRTPFREEAAVSVASLLFSLLIALPLLGVATPAAAAMLEGPVMRASDSMELRGALQHGKLDRLTDLARSHDDTGSLLARGYLAELEGDLERAARFARVAHNQAVDDQQRFAAALAEARILRASGEWKKAEERLRGVLSEHADAHQIRVELGALLIDRGKGSEAETVLETMSRAFNSGRIDGADGLYALGRAMSLLGSFKDANHAFQLAYEKDSDHLPGLVRWGQLFLSKYNTADAEKTFKDALEVNEKHPGALIAMARVSMETSNYYDEARQYLRRAAEVFPASPMLKLTRAEIAIYDGDWTEAMGLAEEVLKAHPKHLEALALKAAVHYLNDDLGGFAETKQRALELNRNFAEIYTRTAEFAVLVHRYREGVELHRKALDVRAEFGEALLGLGIGLSRLGRIEEAVSALQRAFDADPYNVRAYNMLEFFDKKMPNYRTFRRDGFLLRAHASEAPVIESIVGPLVDESMEVYRSKYDFEPADELSVEIYPDPKSFGVRTVGLPHISPHGVCFGRVVATRSPSDGNFNWKQVVWHEMAHVFHIQESGYRVPRWFTEGLAEYETNVKDPAWIRHHEPRIAAALRDEEIPSIVELDRRFTQAKSYVDILQAYHLSSLVIHFIVQEWSFQKINRMVEGFKEEIKTRRVIRNSLDVSIEEFDERFRGWLADRLTGFENQLLIDLKTLPTAEELEESTRPSGRDGWYHARMAVARLRAGESEAATTAMEKALKLGNGEAKVEYVASAFYATRGRSRKAYEHGLAVLEAGRDDYGLRLRLGRLAQVLEELEAAEVHLRAAIQLYPDGSGAWKQLLGIAESTGKRSLKRRAVRRLFELDQTSPMAARRLTELAVASRDWQVAKEGVERWLAIQPFEPTLHRHRIEISMKVDRTDDAVESWDLLAKLRSDAAGEIYRKGVGQLEEAGHREAADRLAGLARDAGVELDR